MSRSSTPDSSSGKTGRAGEKGIHVAQQSQRQGRHRPPPTTKKGRPRTVLGWGWGA